MIDTVVMFSGGIDSLAAWWVLDSPPVIYVDLRTPYSKKELSAVTHIAAVADMELTQVFLMADQPYGFSQTEKGAFFPARNLSLATIGSWYADKVCIAGILGDQVEDKSPEAFAEMSELLSHHSRRDVQVFSPFWEKTKSQVLWEYLNLGGDEDLLALSTSCYHPKKKACGECPSCFRKWVALLNCGLEPGYDPPVHMIEKYQLRAMGDHYPPQMAKEILHAIRLVE